MVWLAFAFMAVAAVLCVSWPLLRPRGAVAGASDVAFYRDQLRELDRDVDRGTLRPADVEATRAELGRRLLQAAEVSGAASAPAPGRSRGIAAALAGAFVIAAAAGLYARVGHPDQADAPLAVRGGTSDFAAAVAKIEAHLASDPNDGRGLEIMAPVYMKMGRFDDAVRTYRDIVRVLGRSPSREAELGQALVMQADGVVTADARQNFDAALRDDPLLPQARFFVGLAALQDGDKARAREIWDALVREAPPEAPYLAIVRQRVAELDGAPPAQAGIPGAPPAAAAGVGVPPGMPGMPPAVAAIASLPAGQQQVAIRGMVDGLAARLAADGHDGAGWLRLVRAYRVLGDKDKAVKALAEARRVMTGDTQVLGQLDSLARELGLES